MKPRNFARSRAKSSTEENRCFSSFQSDATSVIRVCAYIHFVVQNLCPNVFYLLLHVPVFILLLNGSRGAQYGHLIQLQELLTQAVLKVLVQLAAGKQNNHKIKRPSRCFDREFIWSCAFSPAGCLYEIPEELLMSRKGRRRTRADDSMRLDEALLQALQATQAVGSQHSQQVSIRRFSRGAGHLRSFAHLKKHLRCVQQSKIFSKERLWIYLNKLLEEQAGKMRMNSCRGELIHHSSKMEKNNKKRRELNLYPSFMEESRQNYTCLILPPSEASKLHPGSLWKSSHSRSTS